ncbi:hypothetical protein EBU24_04930, partial [bacterium]|nr:hypothetical protein [bacterium]
PAAATPAAATPAAATPAAATPAAANNFFVAAADPRKRKAIDDLIEGLGKARITQSRYGYKSVEKR